MKRYSRVYASVNLDAAIENMEAMHRLLKKDTSMFAVIKTDGYGHGATELARVLEPLPYLHGFCVATVEEGVILRNHGIKKPILILGFAFPDEYEIIVEQKLEPAVFTYDMAVALSEAATKEKSGCGNSHCSGYWNEPDWLSGGKRKCRRDSANQ